MSKKLFALEELNEEVIAPESVDEVEMTESETELESAAAEVNDLQNQVEHATEVAGTLDNIGASLSNLKPEETIPEPVMESLNIAISGLLGSIGMSAKQRSTAMESFSKATTAQMAMESIADTAKKIWEKIKAFFIKIKEASIALYEKLTNVAAKMKSYGKSLQDKAKTFKSNRTAKRLKMNAEHLANLGCDDNDNTDTIYKKMLDVFTSIEKSVNGISSLKVNAADIPKPDFSDANSVADCIDQLTKLQVDEFNKIKNLNGSESYDTTWFPGGYKYSIAGAYSVVFTGKNADIYNLQVYRWCNPSSDAKNISEKEYTSITEQQLKELGSKIEHIGTVLQEKMNEAKSAQIAFYTKEQEEMLRSLPRAEADGKLLAKVPYSELHSVINKCNNLVGFYGATLSAICASCTEVLTDVNAIIKAATF